MGSIVLLWSSRTHTYNEIPRDNLRRGRRISRTKAISDDGWSTNLQVIQGPPLQPTEVIRNSNKRRLPDAKQNLHQNLASVDMGLSGRTGRTYRIGIRAGPLMVWVIRPGPDVTL